MERGVSFLRMMAVYDGCDSTGVSLFLRSVGETNPFINPAAAFPLREMLLLGSQVEKAEKAVIYPRCCTAVGVLHGFGGSA